MSIAQSKAIHRALNDYKLKIELISLEHEKRIRAILDSARKEKIARLRQSLTQ